MQYYSLFEEGILIDLKQMEKLISKLLDECESELEAYSNLKEIDMPKKDFEEGILAGRYEFAESLSTLIYNYKA